MKNKMIKISTKISTALVVAASVMTMASTTAFAAPADEVTLHTTQMTFEITEGEEPHEITDEERQQLRENLARGAKEYIHEQSEEHAKKDADEVIKFFEDIINFFS